MMRIRMAAVFVLLSAPLAPAQPAPVATLPPIGLPLPAIGLPLAPLGLAPSSDTSVSPLPTRPPRMRNQGAAWPWVPVIVYVTGANQPGTIVSVQADRADPPAPRKDDSLDRTARTEPAVDAVVPARAAAAPSPPPEPPPVPKPLYFVPGCYFGDLPPERAGLPATCDLSKTVVYRP